MDQKQSAAIHQCMPQLIDSVDVGAVAMHLRSRNIITREDFERINSKVTSNDSRYTLLEIIQGRDGAWDAFIEALREARQLYLAKMLSSALDQSGSGQQPCKPQQEQNANQSILQELEAAIRLTARRRALEIEQENVISILDAKEAVEVAKTKGVSATQYHDIKTEPNPKRAAQALYDILQRIESGYQILMSYLQNKGIYSETAIDLELACKKQTEQITKQICEFTEKGQTEEKDREKRLQLISMLRRKFDVTEDGTYVRKQ